MAPAAVHGAWERQTAGDADADATAARSNNPARVVLAVNRRSDAKPLLRQLHWLPVRQRVLYKMAVLTQKTRKTGVPAYLNQHLVPHVTVQHTLTPTD